VHDVLCDVIKKLTLKDVTCVTYGSQRSLWH